MQPTGKYLGTYQTPNSPPVVLIVVVSTWVDIRAIQIQVVSVVVIVRGRRPIVAVAASIVNRAAVDVAGVEEVEYCLKAITIT